MSDDDPILQEDLDNLPTVPGLRAGQVLFGRYVLESELGVGGMGVVWRARDVELDEPVALKFLPEVVACDDEAVDELKDETRYARRLTHPNIVRVHQFEHAGAIAAISMELVDGMTLKKLRLAQPAKVFAVGTLAPLVDQLCAALDYAHGQANIVHRDIKPSNILVTRDDVVKVTDFGIARSLADSSTRLTGKGGGVSGTILYMSPQQLHGCKPKGTDDLYSLGAMLYELLTGKPPFFRGDLLSMRMQILKNTPLPLAVQRAQLQIEADPIPPAWSETILACLAKEPEGRPQSAGEVARRLEIGRTKGKGQSTEDEAPLPDARGRRRIVLIAALIALGLGILAWGFWPRSHGRPQLASRPDDAAGGQAALAHTVTAPVDMRRAEAGKTWTVPELDLEMPYIFPGTFTMGSENGDGDEKPLTRVTLTQGLWLGRTEVTQAQWQTLMGRNSANFSGVNRPVEQVSWNDAMEFCRNLTERERSLGRLPEGYVYTLPTEAQWEDVCRAGTVGDYAGDLSEMAWYGGNSGDTTHPVALMHPNAWGFDDMHGNVREWCRDWYGNYPGGSVTDPAGPSSGSFRVVRGGSWSDSAQNCRSASRRWSEPGSASNNLGFRLALAPQVTRLETAQVGREEATAIHEEKITLRPSIPLTPATPAAEAVREIASKTHSDVQTRYDHARELARQGKNVKALAEYLWCFDDGMRKSPEFTEQRLNSLLSSVVKLGQNYPPALEALRQRRDAAKTHVLENTNDISSLVNMVALNRQLGESAANLALFNQLPPGSRGREILGRYVFDQLIEARRYPEAAAAQPFDQFKRLFDLIIKQFDAHPERKGRVSRYVGQSGGKELEALAGAGDLDHARELLQALLKADHSEATISALRDHLKRAGHGELLDGMARGSSR